MPPSATLNSDRSNLGTAGAGAHPVAAGSALRVLPADSRRDRELFLRLPARLYRNDPCWVAPLLFERRGTIAPENPVFEHLRWQPFLAWRGDVVVGRISAQVDSLVQTVRGEDVGYYGLLEAEDDSAVFAALLLTAEQWLRDNGMTSVLGPFNLNINQECGMLVSGFDTIPNMMMGHALPYYERHLLDCGYHIAKELLAYEAPPDFAAPALLTALQRRLAGRLTVTPLNGARKAEELDMMCEIFNDGWANNWGAVPFTQKEFRTVANEMLLLIPNDLIQIARVDGEPAAFIVLLPNLNEALQGLHGKLLPFGWAKLLWRLKVKFTRSARVPLMGVKRKFQNRIMGPGLAFAVIDAVRHVAARKGVKSVEMSWVLEDNVGMRHIAEGIGGVINKRYRMYERALVGPGSSLDPALVVPADAAPNPRA